MLAFIKPKRKVKPKYYIMQITDWGTVRFVDDDLKICTMDIGDFVEYCCE